MVTAGLTIEDEWILVAYGGFQQCFIAGATDGEQKEEMVLRLPANRQDKV
jgi:hypothetical protein